MSVLNNNKMHSEGGGGGIGNTQRLRKSWTRKNVDFYRKNCAKKIRLPFWRIYYSISKKRKSGCYLLVFYRLFGLEIASYF